MKVLAALYPTLSHAETRACCRGPNPLSNGVMQDTSPPYPRLRLLPKRHRRLKLGHPWVYSNEMQPNPVLKALDAGSLVTVENAAGEPVGTAVFNPKPLVVARMISAKPDAALDQAYVETRLQAALALRERLFQEPFYRLIHAETDGLPGVIIDRYGDVIAVQINTAAFDVRREMVIAAIQAVLNPRTIVIRLASAARLMEGLKDEDDIIVGDLDGPIELLENGVVFLADLSDGQKTGWFFDQRMNRAAVANLASGARVLDVYCYLGGFGLNAAMAGAEDVTLVDRSAQALELASEAAKRNGVADKVTTVRSEAFAFLDESVQAGMRWDIVIVDPPAFVKSRKDLSAGLRAYRKMVRLACRLVSPGGFLFAASCSHNVDAVQFMEQVRHGLGDGGRNGRLLREAGAGPDHPVHPFLPESAYLTSALLQLD